MHTQEHIDSFQTLYCFMFKGRVPTIIDEKLTCFISKDFIVEGMFYLNKSVYNHLPVLRWLGIDSMYRS